MVEIGVHICMLKEHLQAQMFQEDIVSTMNPEVGYFYVPEAFKTSGFLDIITCMYCIPFYFVCYLVHRKQPKMQNEATMRLVIIKSGILSYLTIDKSKNISELYMGSQTYKENSMSDTKRG
jgi:hypothetical protein